MEDLKYDVKRRFCILARKFNAKNSRFETLSDSNKFIHIFQGRNIDPYLNSRGFLSVLLVFWGRDNYLAWMLITHWNFQDMYVFIRFLPLPSIDYYFSLQLSSLSRIVAKIFKIGSSLSVATPSPLILTY